MLKDIHFEHSYSSGYDEPKEFFTEALIESSTFDLGLGFFSSSGIRSLAYGFALFIANGGKMRVVINHFLSKEDKEAILNGQNIWSRITNVAYYQILPNWPKRYLRRMNIFPMFVISNFN